MANCPLTLRITKGSKLTFAELDGNFISLANCISSLPQYDSFVTGGTYNISTNSVDFTGNFDFIPFSTDLSYLANMDITVTGGTYDSSTGTVTFYNNSGGTFQVSGFLTGYTNYYTTGVTLNNTTLEFDRTDLSNAYSIDLSSLLFTGNTSGDCITDLYVSNLYGCSPIKVWDNLTLSGSVIDSQGGGYLDLRYGNSDGRFYLGNDNGGYSDTFIQGENGYLEISAYDPAARIAMFTDGGNAGFVLTNDTSFFSTDISLYTDTTSIVSTPNNYIGLGSGNSLEITNDNVWVKGNETFNITTNPHSGVGLGTSSDLLIATVTGTSYTTNTLRETNPSILSSQYSTIQMGIKNSVILGGYNLNATQDNTAYVDNLNINTIGSGTSVINLGLDSSGNVVTGTTGGGTFTGNTSGDCITDLYISNLYGCSPITIHDDIILETGTTISTKNGGGQLELDRLSIGSNVLLSVDNGSASDAFLNLQPGQANLASLLGDVYILSNTSTRMITGGLFNPHSEVLMEPESFKLGIKDTIAPYINDIESVVVYNTRLSEQSTSNASKWPTLVSSKNSTVSAGVLNSVILGGQNITATTNNTVYVDNLNINTIGSGASVINLGLDSNGYVVTGTTGSGVSIDPYYNVGTASTVTWDVSGTSTNYQATLTGNTTLALTNVRNGDYGTIILTQDGTGGRTLTLGTVNGSATTHRVVNGGGGSAVLTSNGNAIDILTFTYNGSVMFWTVGNDYT